MEYQHPRWQRTTFFCFSFFLLIFPATLIILGFLPEREDDPKNYLLGGVLSLIILAIPVELFARSVFSSVAITRKTLIIRPGGLFLRFFSPSRQYPFSDYLFYILLEDDQPVMVDIYNFDKEIQAHIYHPRIQQILLRIARHNYLPHFYIGQINLGRSNG
jgi:hypothetical protein